MRSTAEDAPPLSVLLLREPVSVLQGTDAYHDAFGSFCLPSFALSALESGASTPRTPYQTIQTPEGGDGKLLLPSSPVMERSSVPSYHSFQNNSYLMTHHSAPESDHDDAKDREYCIVSFPILSHSLQNIKELSDRILGAVDGKYKYDGVVITSKRAVQTWVEACKVVAGIMQKRPVLDPPCERIWAEVPFYVVGPATAKSLSSSPLAPMLQPSEIVGATDTGTGEALARNMAQRFAEKPTQTQRLLYLVGNRHSLALEKTLTELKAPVELDELCVYSTEKDAKFESHCRLLAQELPRQIPTPGTRSPVTLKHRGLAFTGMDIDDPARVAKLLERKTESLGEPVNLMSPTGQAPSWIVFFSPSGGDYALPELRARGWVPQPDEGARIGKPMPKIACIGPTTSEWVCERLGCVPDAVAQRPTPASLREAILCAEYGV